jgi:hypothetical protein
VGEFFVAEDDDSTGEAIEMDSGGESEGGDEASPVGKKDSGGGGGQSGPGSTDAVEDKVYVPGQPLDEGEELVHDSSAYCMYHAVSRLKTHTVIRTKNGKNNLR